MDIIPILKGMTTYVPGVSKLTFKGTGGTDSARYCYSVWLRHLVMSHINGLSTQPKVIAELGPGDTLGIGLAALISGANKYYALDIVEYANNIKNIKIFDELVELFRKREDIPDENEFPKVRPRLETYMFPKHILTEKYLEKALRKDRLESIKQALLSTEDNKKDVLQISYFVPWFNSSLIIEESVDMICSQAVMEHVNDLTQTYRTLYRWLKPGGFMSHQIDFECHGITKEWNGHWSYSDFQWKLVKGKRASLINRQPHSVHISLIRKFGFEVVCDITSKNTSGIKRKNLASRFRNISDDDMIICDAFVQAFKKK